MDAHTLSIITMNITTLSLIFFKWCLKKKVNIENFNMDSHTFSIIKLNIMTILIFLFKMTP